MFYYNYLLYNNIKNRFYVGYTSDLKDRIIKHNQGLVQSTKPHRPWILIYYEACLNKKDAMRREKYLKTNQGQRLIKRRLKEYFFDIRNSSSG